MGDVIILAAGGTAGHVFPAAALALELKNSGVETVLISDLRGVKYAKDEFSRVNILHIAKFNFSFFFKAPYLLIKSLLMIRKASCVVCFGGYVSFFPFVAAILLGKERIIYQLDSHITRLNRILMPMANKIFYSFEQTNLKRTRNTFCFGLPLRNGFEFSFIKKDKSLNIAIIGGSLGSDYWKTLMTEALKLIPLEMRRSINLKIQTKESIDCFADFELASFESRPFYDTADLFRNSHLIIARAGATSIAEISSVARASYLVPWNGAVENHQYVNAKNYAQKVGAQFGHDAKSLAQYIMKICDSKEFFYKTCENASKAMPQFAKHRARDFILNRLTRNRFSD